MSENDYAASQQNAIQHKLPEEEEEIQTKTAPGVEPPAFNAVAQQEKQEE